MMMVNDVIIYTTLIKQQKCYFTKIETLTFRNSMLPADCGVVYYERWEEEYCIKLTLHYISRQAEAGAFFYANGIPGDPARDHNATPRAHLYEKSIPSGL